MIIWILIMMIIALSLISGEFAQITEDFLSNHAVTILLVALGMLYWWYGIHHRKRDE